MLLKDFFQMFPDEDSCENYLRAVREEIGVVCPKCGATKYKWGCLEGNPFNVRTVATESR